MKPSPSNKSASIMDILQEMSVGVGDEYHKLHNGTQDFDTTNTHMNYYEGLAEQQLNDYFRGLLNEVIGSDNKPYPPEHVGVNGLAIDDWVAYRNQLRSEQRKRADLVLKNLGVAGVKPPAHNRGEDIERKLDG